MGQSLNCLESTTKRLFYDYCREFKLTLETFSGVTLKDLHEIERFFKVNINVYSLGLKNNICHAWLVRRSTEQFESTLFLDLYKNHFSYIHNFTLYCRYYVCQICKKVFPIRSNYFRHMQTCDASVKHEFIGGAFHTQKSIFQEIENESIFVLKEDCFYCFRVAFDYESYFCKQNLPPNGPQLEWVSEHIPISVSVGSNVPGFLETKCFVSNENVQELVSCKIQYLEEISRAAYRILQEQFRYVFVALERLRDTRLAAEPNSSKEKHLLTRLMNRFDAFLSVLPVLGFNSGRYDLNVAKRFILQSLRDKIEFVVKRNNNYICVKTPLLKFLDIVNYVGTWFFVR